MTSTILKSQLPSPRHSGRSTSATQDAPLEITGDHLRVAVAGVPNADAVADLRDSYGLEVELVPVTEGKWVKPSGRHSPPASRGRTSSGSRRLSRARGRRREDPLADVRDLANQPPVIRFVNLLIREAHDAGASDIHLEATRDRLRVRLRIDGVSAEWPSPTKALQAAVVSRLKLLAELDIAERRAPQDGRIRVRLEQRELDLRVSTVPTLYGESVVLRLLDRGGRPVGLDELGMGPDTIERFRGLAVGLTGSSSLPGRPEAGRPRRSTPPWGFAIRLRRR